MKHHLRHLALPSALNHLRKVKTILRYAEASTLSPDPTRNTLSVQSENLLPIHIGPLVSADNKVLEKFLKRLSEGTSGFYVMS